MKDFDVDYSFERPEYGTLTVKADNIDDAEFVALKLISETEGVDIDDVFIETLKEKHN